MKTTSQKLLVSIVLTTLNGARYLHEAIDSCLCQTYPNIELIIVDGGSTDGTLDTVASYCDRLRLIQQQDNAGKLPGAINLGLDNARGEYLTWMQDDCIYQPTAIARMVEILDAHPEVGQVYADFWEIDADGKVNTVRHTREPDEILQAIGDPAGVCFLIRRSAREAVGAHDVSTHPNHDFDYRMRIGMQFASLRISEPLFSWRIHPHSLSGTISWYELARKDVDIRVRLGLSTPQQALHKVAEIDIAYAFDRYQAGDFGAVPALVVSGLRHNPRFALNRGMWAILVRSLFKGGIVCAQRQRHA